MTVRSTARAILRGILLITGLPLACSRTSLVRPDDQTFSESTVRLVRTSREIERYQPDAEEKVLFMQAEGLYRYRFDFPRMSAWTFVAQALAAAADFPALQTYAGSLDLLELRLRAYDGSVHLWETLLARHPHTPLRPLVLYRLGWAYRNASVPGLPRESGDEAFSELMRSFPQSPLVPLAAAAERVARKSKDKATTYSLLPGLGQMYVGEYGNGSVRLAVALGGLAMVLAPSLVAYERRRDLSWGHDWPLLVTGVAGLIVLSIDYTLAYQDALRGVVQFNERAERRFEAEHPEAP